MLSIMLATVLCWLGTDLNDSRTWYASYAKALDEVHRVDRPLFVLFDAGSSPVGRMVTSGQYMSEQVEKALVADYLRMFVDTETKSGKALAAQFGADELPRIVIIDRTGDWQVYRRSGNPSADEVLAVLAQYRRSKISSSSSSITVETRFYPPGSSFGSAILCKS